MDPSFEWPDLLLQIQTSSRPEARVSLLFKGVVNGGTEQRDFGSVEIHDPLIRVNQLGQVLDAWADPAQSKDWESLSSHLNGIGIRFFEDLIPPELKEHYWDKLHPSPGATVMIVAEPAAAALPWELIKPARPGDEAPFWCEHLSFSRWMPDHPVTQSLPGRPVACVLADHGLADIGDAAHALLKPEHIVDDWKSLKGVLQSNGVGIFHWTGHGQSCPENPSFSALPIGSETFRPVDLLTSNLRQFLSSDPWVFLHACSTTREAQGFIGLGGWPSDLIAGGAGAVLGTAWDVRATTAIPFVEGLYDRILNGAPIGTAVREARAYARIEGDPSWLSYQLYGHPGARLDKSSASGVRTTASLKSIVQQKFPRAAGAQEAWRREYLQSIASPHEDGHAAVVSLAATADIDKELEYATLYVEPAGFRHVVSHSFTKIVDAVLEYGCIVLLGRSGAGKTATLHKIMQDFAKDALNGQSDLPIPVYVSLDEFEADDHPLTYVLERCDEGLRPHLENELAKKRICFLCDGVNQLSRLKYKTKIKAWRDFVKKYRGNRFVFACRTPWYQDELHLQKVEISPLDDERVVRMLFAAVAERADDLWESLRNGGLLEVARTPLFLNWILQSYRGSGGKLPKNRSLLVKGLLDTLVLREMENGDYENLTSDGAAAVLAELAFELQRETSAGAISRQMAEGLVGDHASSPEALKFALDVGLIKESNGELRFGDHQFRDYYAAVALANRFQDGEDLSAYCKPSALRSSPASAPSSRWQALPPQPTTDWEDVLVLASSLAADGAKFLRHITAANPRLAGECLSRNAPAVDAETIDTVRAEILRVATNASSTPLRERLASATTLGRVGDPRFQSVESAAGGRYIPPDLIHIPTGTVSLGSGDHEQDAFADERPQHDVVVPEFRIARHCVTNAEYRLFIDNGGYNDQQYWTPSGWQWRNIREGGQGSVPRMLKNLAYFRGHVEDMERWFEDATLPMAEQETWRRLLGLEDREASALLLELGFGMTRSKDAPPFLRQPRFGGLNQPVVGVTWYEAMAYCSWLSRMSGRRITLPSEVQWERAAKGDNKWIYPWGNAWEADRCNDLSTRLLQPAPVGIFPRGRSPFGCEDMVGNVFEWTTSVYRSYPYDQSNGREDDNSQEVRVNRGGGWDSVQRVTRCALRGDMCGPDCYDRNLGFRVGSQ